MQSFADGRVRLHAGDCLDVLKTLAENSVDSVVCDPPYHLHGSKSGKSGFMGKAWDGGDIAFRPDVWREALRVLKPGGHLVAFSSTRTYHRMAVAIEDAGFEIRDMVPWLYGQGFPKSLDVSKAIDKAAGAKRERELRPKCVPNGAGANVYAQDEWTRTVGAWSRLSDEAATDTAREWSGFGTALKPALEPTVLARKPLSERTVAANVLRWGTGALNVDGCRLEGSGNKTFARIAGDRSRVNYRTGTAAPGSAAPTGIGRWPANLAHDGSPEVLAEFPVTASGETKAGTRYNHANCVTFGTSVGVKRGFPADSGSAARFFYCAKASRRERAGSKHPTVKPLKLMRWLVRLVTPPGGVVLDPFAGTGTTAQAALAEGFDAVLIEREAEYRLDITRRLRASAVGSRQSAVGSRQSRRAYGALRAPLGRTIGPSG